MEMKTMTLEEMQGVNGGDTYIESETLVENGILIYDYIYMEDTETGNWTLTENVSGETTVGGPLGGKITG